MEHSREDTLSIAGPTKRTVSWREKHIIGLFGSGGNPVRKKIGPQLVLVSPVGCRCLVAICTDKVNDGILLLQPASKSFERMSRTRAKPRKWLSGEGLESRWAGETLVWDTPTCASRRLASTSTHMNVDGFGCVICAAGPAAAEGAPPFAGLGRAPPMMRGASAKRQYRGPGKRCPTLRGRDHPGPSQPDPLQLGGGVGVGEGLPGTVQGGEHRLVEPGGRGRPRGVARGVLGPGSALRRPLAAAKPREASEWCTPLHGA